MKRKLLTVLLSLIAALCLCFGLVACDKGNGGSGENGNGSADSGTDTDLWTVERLYAEAQAKGFEGSLDDLIALFKGETGPQGEKGKDGVDGKDGADGKDGVDGKNGVDGKDGIDGKNGIGVDSVEIDENGHLKVTLTDGTVIDAGKVTPEEPVVNGTAGLEYSKIEGENGEYTVAVRGIGTACDTEIVIPDTYQGMKVTAIADYAFLNCTALRSITIPDSVTEIGFMAFEECTSLVDLKIPDGVTEIKVGTFYDCISLTSIRIPEKVTVIEGSAFACCTALTDISIPDGLTVIGYRAFYCCTALTDIRIPDGVTAIDHYAFEGCTSLTKVTIPDSVNTIGVGAFYNCASLSEIKLPEGITEISNFTFYRCESLKNITLPESLLRIGGQVFYDCIGLTSIVFPENVNFIAHGTFEGCYRLVEVWDLTASGTVAMNAAYYGLTNRDTKIYRSKEQSKQVFTSDKYLFYEDETSSYLIDYCGEETELTLPALSPQGRKYSVRMFAFYGYDRIRSVNTGDGVLSLDTDSFRYCTSLEHVTLGNSVETLGNGVFLNCEKLKDINIPQSVSEIGIQAFDMCNQLSSVKFASPDNWVCYVCSWGDGYTEIAHTFTHEELSDPGSAAKFLWGAYALCLWEKTATV